MLSELNFSFLAKTRALYSQSVSLSKVEHIFLYFYMVSELDISFLSKTRARYSLSVSLSKDENIFLVEYYWVGNGSIDSNLKAHPLYFYMLSELYFPFLVKTRALYTLSVSFSKDEHLFLYFYMLSEFYIPFLA